MYMFVCMYIYICVYTCVYIYKYIYSNAHQGTTMASILRGFEPENGDNHPKERGWFRRQKSLHMFTYSIA